MTPEEKDMALNNLARPVTLEINVVQSLGIICAIQLASKHPEYPQTDMGNKTIEFARSLQESLRPLVPAVMMIAIDNGWLSGTTEN